MEREEGRATRRQARRRPTPRHDRRGTRSMALRALREVRDARGGLPRPTAREWAAVAAMCAIVLLAGAVEGGALDAWASQLGAASLAGLAGFVCAGWRALS